MIGELLERGVVRIVGADLDESRVRAVRARFPEADILVETVARGDDSVLATECDIVAPCAVGATLNPETIPRLRASIVCGAANNQLADTERDGRALQERGVVYVPDFLANRMGIVNCANEQYGVFDGDPAVHAHLLRDTPFGGYQRTCEVLRRAADMGTTSADEAQRLADELLAEPHPIWPHRGWQIVQSLIDDGWENQRDD